MPSCKQLSDSYCKIFLVLVLVLTPVFLIIFLSSPKSFSLPLSFSSSNQTEQTYPRNQTRQTYPRNQTRQTYRKHQTRHGLDKARIAVCLVGGARRFELTGPSIIQNVLEIYPYADLFLHSPLDSNSYKFSLLKSAPRIATVRIFKPKRIKETEPYLRVLNANGSPNGIQGLLQYFNLVEGCLTIIKSHQRKNNFTYDWIVRTRVDGYWSSPLGPENFVPGKYIVPSGTSFGGLNDRFGVGDLNTSSVALSRLSLIPTLNSAKFHRLNSEASFKAQLTVLHVPYVVKRIPFCVVSDRRYRFPHGKKGVPVAALSSQGPLSGAKCRPCKAVCRGSCVDKVMSQLHLGWSGTDWANGSVELCDAHGKWDTTWEKIFDRTVGMKLKAARGAVMGLTIKQCVKDFEEMRRRMDRWEAPEPTEICKIGLAPS